MACEVVLNTGNITLESGIARGTVNPFNFILTCALPGGVRPAGQGQSGAVGEGNSHGNKDINPKAVNVR